MKEKLVTYIKSAISGITVAGWEEKRVEADLAAAAKTVHFHLYAWSVTTGIRDMKTGLDIPDTAEPDKALDAFEKMDEKSILLMRDFHFYTAVENPALIRRIKEVLASGRLHNRVLVVLGCELRVIKELSKEFAHIEFALPDREQLDVVLTGIAESAQIELNGDRDLILDAGSGGTTTEFEDWLAISIVESKGKKIDPLVIARLKAETVRKNGILEIIDSNIGLDDIGGLEDLKEHLFLSRKSFSKAAREYGLPSPRPILLVGQPGTGKSLCAEAIRNIFGITLLRLEASRLFGSLQGETERNWREAFAMARAIRPVCFWVDEVDGLLTGAQSSGQTDGGTTARLIKTILQDMQMNSEGIFFIFTANDIDSLPDPFIDRCELWSVDLPMLGEREAVWKIQIAKARSSQSTPRKPSKFDLKEFAKQTEGFSGRQIEQAWVRAMSVAFNADREPTNEDVLACLKKFVPTSVTMAESIDKRRKRLAGRAQPASRPEATPPPAAGNSTADTIRKLAVHIQS